MWSISFDWNVHVTLLTDDSNLQNYYSLIPCFYTYVDMQTYMAVITLGSIGGGRARVREHFYHNFKNANQRGRKEITVQCKQGSNGCPSLIQDWGWLHRELGMIFCFFYFLSYNIAIVNAI